MGDIIKSAISPRSCCNKKIFDLMFTSLIISKKLICVTPIQRLVIGSCKHDVIELGQLSQRYEQTTRKSLLSQLSQLFRPWTVGTMDCPNNCPNVLNRLVDTLHMVGTLGTIVPTFEHTTTFCFGQLSQVELSQSVRALRVRVGISLEGQGFEQSFRATQRTG